MRKIIIIMSAIVLLTACSGHDVDQGELAGRTAKIYYDMLRQGKYAEFVDGHYRPDSIPAGYRSQLIDNARMFMAQQNDEHSGIKAVSVLRATADTARHEGVAYLLLCYGDSAREEVAVPMAYVDGIWMMR